jgi:putative membrane protein
MRHPLISTALLTILLAFAGAALPADKSVRKGEPTSLSRADQRFINEAMRDNQTEIALANLAKEKASSAAVKRFADRLLADHTRANAELQSIASKLGHTPSKKLIDLELWRVKKFQKMEPDKFDRAFVKHMVDDHEKAIKLFRKESQDGQAEEVWQFATRTLPTLEQHLKMARELSSETGARKKRK